MAMMQALALLAGAAGGFARRQKEDRDQARQDELDAFNRERQQQQRTQWLQQNKVFEQQQADRDAERAAMAPTTVDDAPVAPPIGSRDEPRAPEDQGIRAAGQTFTNRADADEAATAYNALPNRIQRAAAAVTDPVRAAQLETTAQNAEAGTMARIAARRKESDDAFNRDLMNSVNDFTSLESFVNASKGDGQNGALQIKIVPNPDGKTVAVMKLGADGTMTPTPFNFPNTTEGVQQAVGIIGMRLPPEQKLAHLQAAAKTEEERRRWGLEFGLKEKDSVTRGKREDRMATAAERQAAAAERTATAAAARAAAANNPGALTLSDLKDGHKTIATTLNADYTAQLSDTSLKQQDAAAIKTIREREIADVQRLYTGAMSNGIPLTPEQAIAAFRTGKRATAEVHDTEGKKHTVEVMVVGNRLIPFASAPGKEVPKPAAAVPAVPAAPGAVAKPAPPAGGPMARVAASVAAASEPGQGPALDAARLAEAKAQKRLLTFGARQRAADPAGFDAAQREHRVAVQAVREAEEAWRASVQQGGLGSAFRYAQP